MRWPILLTMLFIISCKKEDDIPPVLEISQPLNNQTYIYQDYIHITGKAKDETIVMTLSYEIWDQSLNVRSKQVVEIVEKNEVIIDYFLLLDNVKLPSGQYYLKIVVNDGTNTKSEFISFNYVEAPLILLEKYLLVKDQSNYELYKDINNQFVFDKFIGNDSTYFEIDSWNQILLMAGSTNEGVRAYSYPNHQLNWQLLPSVSQVSDWIITFDLDKENSKNTLSFSDGSKKVINSAGTTSTLIGSSAQGWFGEEMILEASQFVIVDEVNVNSHQLASYFQSTGVLNAIIPVPFDIKGFKFNQAQQKIELFAENQGNVEIYDYSNGTLSSLKQTINNSGFKDLETISNGVYVVGLSTGLYLYDSASNLMTLINSISTTDVEFDPISNTIYCVDSVGVHQYDLAGNLLNSTPIIGAVDLEFLYNK